ncbi:MAG: hypothetical protein HYX94_11345 [Chloroflexi bacterium]|nr:hypothetical protein [Chloroflexota bacterium]
MSFDVGRAAPGPYHLAARILAGEAGRYPGEAEPADAAGRVCEKLRQALAQLIGFDAVLLLMRQALRRTVGDFPFLKDVDVAVDGCLEGLRESVGELDPEQVREAVVMLLTNLIGQLSDLIGEDLTLQLVRDMWPEITSDRSEP